MKILQVPFCFHPDAVGGTEVFVEALAHQLRAQGVESVIAAPGRSAASYEHDGLPVRRYPIADDVNDLRELYGEGDAAAAAAFSAVLDTAQPDIVHIHALTRGVSLRCVREAKRREIPVVFTYHTPTVSCPRGTLLRWGDEVCDGVLDLNRCSSCALQGHGLSRTMAGIVGRTPTAIGNGLGATGLSGGIWTALRMRSLIERRHGVFRALMAEVDHVVAVCEWVRRLLLDNGVPLEKITLSRQGLCREVDANPERRAGSETLRLVYLGRLDPTKGVHILIEAIRGRPELPISLDIFGIAQGPSGASYQTKLQILCQADARISWRDPVPSAALMQVLGAYDVLAVPSQCLETGPLVVLEAFAAGIPVIGSNLGGIAELVSNGVNGLLVGAASIPAWQKALERVVGEKDLLLRLRSGVRPPRTMAAVAEEMAVLYGNLSTPPSTRGAAHGRRALVS